VYLVKDREAKEGRYQNQREREINRRIYNHQDADPDPDRFAAPEPISVRQRVFTLYEVAIVCQAGAKPV